MRQFQDISQTSKFWDEVLPIRYIFDEIMEKGNTFYRDLRFWVVVFSLLALIGLVVQGYPI